MHLVTLPTSSESLAQIEQRYCETASRPRVQESKPSHPRESAGCGNWGQTLAIGGLSDSYASKVANLVSAVPMTISVVLGYRLTENPGTVRIYLLAAPLASVGYPTNVSTRPEPPWSVLPKTAMLAHLVGAPVLPSSVAVSYYLSLFVVEDQVSLNFELGKRLSRGQTLILIFLLYLL